MDARIAEVYGCSEFGSMAVRDTAKTETWTLFDAFQFEPQEDGSCRAYASHIKEEIILGDLVELIGDNQFKLGGRTDDTINIAGKRGSLAELNRVLLQCQGVLDGVVFLPPEKQRLAALVILQPDFSKEQLAQYFRQHIDAAFVPRPMLAVAALPRSDNSKLSKKAVLELYQRTVKPKP